MDLSIEPEISMGLNVKNRQKPKQEIVIEQTGSLGALASGNYADIAETVSGELVNFRKTRFRDSVCQSEA